MRLDKLLANTGYGSRKDVKVLLKKKQVTVNGTIMKDGKSHVNPTEDVIMVDKERVHYREYIYLMMNKPQGVLSATEDRKDKTVIDLLTPEYQHFQPFPVGRLDKDTEGFLLITNDGQLAHQLLSPKKDFEKTYFAKIEGKVTNEDVELFRTGVPLEDGYVAKPAKLNIISSNDVSEIEITITEGKFHQVKRMFLSVGKKVTYLQRIGMGEISLDETLSLGNYRELTEEELSYFLSQK